jgi:tRNA-2-methylthio-N6-dimethylallyladenosine synthase
MTGHTRRVFIKTFGCQMNEYDSSRMRQLLVEQAGYQPADDPAEADLVVFNTCHIREKADDKLFSELGRLRVQLRNRDVIFAVGGCVGQAVGTTVFRRAPFVHIVFGPQNYHRLPEMLERVAQGEQHICDLETVETTSKFDVLPALVHPVASASVTVQEGCDKFCAFCVVPLTRGREWSRPVNDIVAEVEQLVRRGAVEIQLLGQNVNAYRGMDTEGVVHDLALLIRRVALLPEIRRIRFITSHPADMNDDLVEVFADLPQLCPYLHLPIQSGSDRILQRMGREHTVQSYLDWVQRLRAARPDIALASDFIVGFPGETEEDFAATMDLVDAVQFDHAYSFRFSARPGTPAAGLSGQLDDQIVADRLQRLQRRLEEHQWQSNQRQVGRTVEVLVEGPARMNPAELSGRTPDMRSVNFPGHPQWIGTIVAVTLTEGMPNSLRGRIAS